MQDLGTNYPGLLTQDYTVLNLEQQAQIVEDWFIGNGRMTETNTVRFNTRPKITIAIRISDIFKKTYRLWDFLTPDVTWRMALMDGATAPPWAEQ